MIKYYKNTDNTVFTAVLDGGGFVRVITHGIINTYHQIEFEADEDEVECSPEEYEAAFYSVCAEIKAKTIKPLLP